MARPTKLTKALLEQAKGYLVYYQDNEVVPTIAGLALHLGVCRPTIYDWAAEEGSEFSYIVSDIQATQEQKLINGGLRGDMNASITKLMLSKHGYAEKTEQTLSGPDGGPIQTSSTFQFIGVNADSD